MNYQGGGGGGLSYSATIGPSSSTSSASGFSSFFAGKRKKPKSNIGKTNSTFVAKITTNENLAKILANRVNEDVYLFWNTGRTFTWSDLGQKPNEPLSHISFSKAFPTAHDVNILTRSCDHLDVIIGFSTGDIIWFNPLSNKYSRLNKQAIIKDSAVTTIKWLPGSESQFMVAFQDGSIVMMDKDKDDNAFTTPTPPDEYRYRPILFLSLLFTSHLLYKYPKSFHATKPKHGRHNPISHWHISRKPINAFAFSPDLQHVAVVAADGELRIIDFRNERLIETFTSYFGALSCVCWSPDGKYILTGGQDDLVTIWSFKDLRIVARCQGHQNYVTGVAFDSWRCDERNYRFGSVGEDAKLLLWDFSVGSLHKPKAQQHQHSLSTMFHHPNACNSRKSEEAGGVTPTATTAATGLRGSVDAEREGEHPVAMARPPERRSRVAMLQPLMATAIHHEPLASITFREDAILTSDRRGHIKVWKRPARPAASSVSGSGGGGGSHS
ncbi:MAG: WD40-repeat-containing domain protein [Linnemannia elongata]|nr:MAG: WD40-repeat-containing domain protein [Linnemannia elongata]